MEIQTIIDFAVSLQIVAATGNLRGK